MDPALDDLFERQLFEYVFPAVVQPLAIQQPGNLAIGSDADFEWWFNKVKYIPGPGVAMLKLLMKEAATGRDFIGTTASAASGTPGTFNGMDIDLWGGQANLTGSFPLAIPYVMPATRVYQLYLTDYSPPPGTLTNVQLVFSGFKLWPRPKIGDTSGVAHPGAGTSSHAGAPSQGGGPSGVSGYWGY